MKSSVSCYVLSDGLCDTFTVTSSNPKVAGATIEQGSYIDSRGKIQTFVQLNVVSGIKAGSATITVKTCDGTGRSASLKVKVIS